VLRSKKFLWILLPPLSDATLSRPPISPSHKTTAAVFPVSPVAHLQLARVDYRGRAVFCLRPCPIFPFFSMAFLAHNSLLMMHSANVGLCQSDRASVQPSTVIRTGPFFELVLHDPRLFLVSRLSVPPLSPPCAGLPGRGTWSPRSDPPPDGCRIQTKKTALLSHYWATKPPFRFFSDSPPFRRPFRSIARTCKAATHTAFSISLPQ